MIPFQIHIFKNDVNKIIFDFKSIRYFSRICIAELENNWKPE